MTPDELVQAALEWLLDLDGASSFLEFEDRDDYETYVVGLPADKVKDAVNRHYDGGWAQFERDC